MAPAATTDTVLSARQRFFNRGELAEGLVAAPILRSWQRCAEQGLDVSDPPRVEPLSAPALRELQQRHDLLRRMTRPEIDALRADAKLTDSVVILTDAAGLVLDMAGNTVFADRASKVALRPGVPWSETATGTNAIGAALVERRPIAVHGAEHFFNPHRILACAAAPILDPRGVLAGVLDMSGHASVRHVHALGLVRLAVEQIEHRFFEQGFSHCTMFRFHRDRELLGTAREGILVFEGERLVAANRHALQLIQFDWSALDRLTAPEVFGRAEPSGVPRQMRTEAGLDVVCRVIAPQSPGIARTAKSRPPASRPHGAPEPLLSSETQAALARAVRLLEADVPVLVQGETGTGKDMFARAAHGRSNRAGQPFVAINCASLPESLIESELFGYEEGAFTGARRQGQKGLLRQADRGVLFLDEIGDMPLGLQARLLRVLQDKAVSPLGSGRPVPVDFALICATHRSLGALVKAGQFRQDLYFRIAPYVIDLPPLRALPDRRALVRAMWQRLGGAQAGVVLSSDVEDRLAAHDWPGNFRQLSGLLQAMLALAEPGQMLDAAALPPDFRRGTETPVAAGPAEYPLSHLTREAMRAALEACGGNVSRAARQLGIDRSTLYRRVLRGRGDG
ncbi:sigma-54-dependent Fis family transcriptional regulator [Azorhizobium doebereinerae]|uniref:sigma-54-dependent Fis family transcriptional regulator n=1 Tax=Azorhizobium doebereinerae TaxID=281091 RepID=UPI00040394F2|nr:sigma-54-dependent Fis family transcriptional regulator [Azorhizobium doebereinerae]